MTVKGLEDLHPLLNPDRQILDDIIRINPHVIGFGQLPDATGNGPSI
jgi:hypothetical protein